MHTHTHPFNGLLSGTTRLSRYQKGKTNLDFTEARDSEWQWHLLGHMQPPCTSLQPRQHPTTQFLQVPFLPLNRQRQSTEGTGDAYSVLIFIFGLTSVSWPPPWFSFSTCSAVHVSMSSLSSFSHVFTLADYFCVCHCTMFHLFDCMFREIVV